MDISSVYMFGNSINFNITCDYLICYCLDLMDGDNAATIKYELALYGLFDDLGCDDNGDGIVAKMESFGMELNYFFMSMNIRRPLCPFRLQVTTLPVLSKTAMASIQSSHMGRCGHRVFISHSFNLQEICFILAF